MKKTNLTFISILGKIYLSMFFLSALTFSSTLNAQCSLDCIGQYNASLNQDCEHVVALTSLIDAQDMCDDAAEFEVRVFDKHGDLVPDATVNASHIGTNVTYELHALDGDGNSINHCWGSVLVEDKVKPTIECPDSPIEVNCGDDLDAYEPTAMDNCGNAEVSFTDLQVITNCSELPTGVIKRIIRRYVATDSYGTISEPCEITIDVVIPDEEVVFPPNYLYFNDTSDDTDPEPSDLPALKCDGNWAKLDNGHPSPVAIGSRRGTGTPTIGGKSLYPDGDADCGFMAAFTDVKIEPFPGSTFCVTKVMRTWTVISWSCANLDNPEPRVQMIEILDEEGPTFDAVKPVLATTQGHSCSAEVELEYPSNLQDNCHEVSHVTVSNLDGNMINEDLRVGDTFTFDEGIHRLIYRAYDSCGNVTVDSSYVLVRDNTPPVPVCDENTTVALTNDGTAWVKATSFDDGSYDECNLKTMVAKRMDPGTCDCETPNLPHHKYLGEYNGKHLFLSDHAFTFNEANKFAQAYEGELAIVKTQAKLDWIEEQVFTDASLDSIVFIGMGRDDWQDDNKWVNGDNATSPFAIYPLDNNLMNIRDRIMRLVEFDANSYFSPYFSGYAVAKKRSIKGYNRFRVADTPGYLFEVPGYEQEILRRSAESDDDAVVLGSYKMKYVVEMSNPCGFSSHVKFCCEDVDADDLMVTLRVIDASGNYNDCMVNVDVQDKIPATIECPEDMVRDCGFLYDENDLAATFGVPTVTDNCASVEYTESVTSNFDDCGLGTIKRTFSVGNVSCTQTITFRPIDPFDGDDIGWPEDVTLESCGDPTSDAFLPDNLPVGSQRPDITSGACDLAGANYTDEVYYINNPTGEACFKIIRKWTVIDWCQFNDPSSPDYNPSLGYTGYKKWTDYQTIKVKDSVAPEITSDCSPKSVNTFDANCASGYIELGAAATDETCTEVLDWEYLIDAFNDGSFDSGLGKSGKGNSIDASGNYPVGTHRIRYVFSDKCGNQTYCDQLFTIVNAKTPTPYLIDGLVMPLMPVMDSEGNVINGMAEIWASDFDKGSSHPCGYEVLFSFEPVTLDASGNPVVVNGRTYDCGDVGTHMVDVYVAVVIDGQVIQDYATTTLRIQDNQNICPDNLTPRAVVSGTITTVGDELLPGAEVTLEGSELDNEMTSMEGEYAFPEMTLGGAYVVNPNKDDAASNGVSTIDIVMIQRHILGKSIITDPYKLVAADVNNDGVIDPQDLLDIRKVVLRIDNEFNNNESWRFVDANYTFDANDPLGITFPEAYNIAELNGDMAVDFMAIKTGDVNNSVEIEPSADTRTTTTLATNDVAFVKGQNIVMPIMASNDMDIAALQFTLSFDADKVTFAGIESGVLNVSEENIGMNYATRGEVTFSFASTDGVDVTDADALFTVNFVSTNAGSIADNVSITSTITEAELLDGDAVTSVGLNVRSGNVDTEVSYELSQNTPNPFSHTTSITVDCPEASYGSFVVTDMTGKVVVSNNVNFVKGNNTIVINRNDLSATGIYYYTVNAGEFTATKKMVLID